VSARRGARACGAPLMLVVALAAAAPPVPRAAAQPLPPSALRVRGSAAPFWRADRAPAVWTAPDSGVARALRWQRLDSAVAWAELPLQGTGEAWRLRLVVVRADPRALPWTLELRRDAGGGRWSVREAGDARVALNAGHFNGGSPWGWVVIDGVERLPPQHGPLAAALLQRPDGSIAWVRDAAVDSVRQHHRARRGAGGAGAVRWAFQSFPVLLDSGGVVPPALRAGRALRLGHRDRRLAIGTTRDGALLVALTVLDLPGAGEVPVGLTLPELAAVMGALGAERAMALDGGISAQLQVGAQRWPGWRDVPLALVAPSAAPPTGR
jgi:uncharacterized protein YigE (DUF2233 family)